MNIYVTGLVFECNHSPSQEHLIRIGVTACRSVGVYSPPLAGGEHKGRGQCLMVNCLLETSLSRALIGESKGNQKLQPKAGLYDDFARSHQRAH